ncbi:MAG: RDD family protein [Pirellula sp.]
MSQFENPYAPSDSPGGFQSEPVMDGTLATLSERFAAAFVDGIINFIAVVPFAFGAGIVVGAMFGDNAMAQLVAQAIGGVIAIGLFLAIHGYFLATRSQTLGKMLLKTKIVSDSGAPLSFGELYTKRYLVLQVLSLIPIVGGLISLVDVLFIFRPNRKCLHDDIAGTKVIKLPA